MHAVAALGHWCLLPKLVPLAPLVSLRDADHSTPWTLGGNVRKGKGRCPARARSICSHQVPPSWRESMGPGQMLSLGSEISLPHQDFAEELRVSSGELLAASRGCAGDTGACSQDAPLSASLVRTVVEPPVYKARQVPPGCHIPRPFLWVAPEGSGTCASLRPRRPAFRQVSVPCCQTTRRLPLCRATEVSCQPRGGSSPATFLSLFGSHLSIQGGGWWGPPASGDVQDGASQWEFCVPAQFPPQGTSVSWPAPVCRAKVGPLPVASRIVGVAVAPPQKPSPPTLRVKD